MSRLIRMNPGKMTKAVLQHGFAALMVLGSALALAACDGEKTPPVPEAKLVQTISIVPGSAAILGKLPGDLEARYQSNLGFQISGQLVQRLVDLGAVVKKGDVLAILDDTNERNSLYVADAQLESAKASLYEATRSEWRLRQLLSRGNTTQALYDDALRSMLTARAAVGSAEAQLKIAKDNLSYTQLIADNDGVITATGAEPGQVVASGAMIVNLARTDAIDAVFYVSDEVAAFIPENPGVEVSLATSPDVKTSGRVRVYNPEADPVTRTHLVKIALDNPPTGMRLGSTVVGQLNLPASEIIEIPHTAVRTTDKGRFVWLVDKASMTIRSAKVELADAGSDSAGGRVIVKNGLSANDILVTSGVNSLNEGDRVRLEDGALAL